MSLTMGMRLIAKNFTAAFFGAILTIYATRCWIIRLPCKKEASFTVKVRGHILKNCKIGESSVAELEQCYEHCINHHGCKSINYKDDGEKNCQLNSKVKEAASANDFEADGVWTYYATNYNTTNIGTYCKDHTPCPTGTYCIDTCQCPGYECVECSPGYGFKYETQCADIDECASSPCQNGGQCNNHVNRFSCTCLPNTSGRRCQFNKSSSCKAAYDGGNRINGEYNLTIGAHFCLLNGSICGEGGWTLAIKSKGNSDVFKANSDYWTTRRLLYQIPSLDEDDAKYQAFNVLSFTKICLAIKKYDESTYRAIVFDKINSSLLSVFQGRQTEIDFAREDWKMLRPDAELQQYCNINGFNIRDNRVGIGVRFGILGNNENDCTSPDSAIGIGIGHYQRVYMTNLGDPSQYMAYLFVE